MEFSIELRSAEDTKTLAKAIMSSKLGRAVSEQVLGKWSSTKVGGNKIKNPLAWPTLTLYPDHLM